MVCGYYTVHHSFYYGMQFEQLINILPVKQYLPYEL